MAHPEQGAGRVQILSCSDFQFSVCMVDVAMKRCMYAHVAMTSLFESTPISQTIFRWAPADKVALDIVVYAMGSCP